MELGLTNDRSFIGIGRANRFSTTFGVVLQNFSVSHPICVLALFFRTGKRLHFRYPKENVSQKDAPNVEQFPLLL